MKVTVRKQIHGTFASASSLDRVVRRVVDLPALPPIGTELHDEGYWIAMVRELALNVETGEVTVWDDSDKTIYDAQLRRDPAPPIEELIARWVEEGWMLEGDS
jgi:hypothetical protein